MPHVNRITTLGPHNMAAVSRKDWEAAKAYGTHVVPLRKLRSQGAAASLAHIPDGERVYVSIDIDSFDPSIAPGTATISHGGFSYYEGKDILREVARRFEVVGADFVEVSPPYDPSGITSLWPHEPVSTSSVPSSTNAPGDADETGCPAVTRGIASYPYSRA
jgi:agmatinase